MTVLFFSLILLFPFGQLTKIPLGIPSVNLYLQDIIIALLVFSWLAWHFLKKEKFVLPPLTKPIFGFACVAFISWALNIHHHSSEEIIIAFLYLLRWAAYAGVYFVVWEITSLFKYPIGQLLIGANFLSAVFGLVQYVFLPDTRFLYYSGWDEHYYRLIGTFLDPGFTGMIYVLTLILVIKKFWHKKSIFYPLFSLFYLALVLTYARSVYLAYLVAMAVVAWQKKSAKFFLVTFLLLVLTLPLLPRPGGEGIRLERKTSVIARTTNWQKSLMIIKDHPILGIGFNFYRYVQRDYGFLGEDWQVSHAGAGADSSLLFVWATCGVVGFVFYLWLLLEMVRICPAAILALVAHSFFNNSLFYPWIMLWMWILISSSVLLPALSTASTLIKFSPSERVKR